MQLIDALSLQDQEMVAFVGGGGKSSLIRALAEECLHRGKRVLLTTTTKMYRWQMDGQAQLVVEEDWEKLLGRIKKIIPNCNVIAAGRGTAPDDKILGLDEETIHLLYKSSFFNAILIEADGANRKPIKAPNDREPVVPSLCTLVVPIVGLDALDSKLTEEYVHRPEILSQITGQPEGSIVTEETMAKILVHYARLVRRYAPDARIIVVLNKIDNEVVHHKAKRIASNIVCNSEVNKVLLTSLLHSTPVQEVISK